MTLYEQVADFHGDIIILPSDIVEIFFVKLWFNTALLGLVW
jgi:hypothetical protein